VRLVERSLPGAWSQGFLWHKEGLWGGGQVLRFVTANTLLIVRLIRAAF